MARARPWRPPATAKLGLEVHQAHHRIYRLDLEGRLVARTFLSRGQRELTGFHAGQMAKQMRLSGRESLEAVECPLDRESYYALVRQRLDMP
jgi:predicted transcriptional regulator